MKMQLGLIVAQALAILAIPMPNEHIVYNSRGIYNAKREASPTDSAATSCTYNCNHIYDAKREAKAAPIPIPVLIDNFEREASPVPTTRPICHYEQCNIHDAKREPAPEPQPAPAAKTAIKSAYNCGNIWDAKRGILVARQCQSGPIHAREDAIMEDKKRDASSRAYNCGNIWDAKRGILVPRKNCENQS